jgi:hypothetical protein
MVVGSSHADSYQNACRNIRTASRTKVISVSCVDNRHYHSHSKQISTPNCKTLDDPMPHLALHHPCRHPAHQRRRRRSGGTATSGSCGFRHSSVPIIRGILHVSRPAKSLKCTLMSPLFATVRAFHASSAKTIHVRLHNSLRSYIRPPHLNPDPGLLSH